MEFHGILSSAGGNDFRNSYHTQLLDSRQRNYRCFDVIHTIILGILDFGGGNDFGNLHFCFSMPGIFYAAKGNSALRVDTVAGAAALLLFVM